MKAKDKPVCPPKSKLPNEVNPLDPLASIPTFEELPPEKQEIVTEAAKRQGFKSVADFFNYK
jgi:hypothetical protein